MTFNGEYPYKAYSVACSPKGDGQCDGIVGRDEDSEYDECACVCHTAWDGPFTVAYTVEAMHIAHTEYWEDMYP